MKLLEYGNKPHIPYKVYYIHHIDLFAVICSIHTIFLFLIAGCFTSDMLQKTLQKLISSLVFLVCSLFFVVFFQVFKIAISQIFQDFKETNFSSQ